MKESVLVRFARNLGDDKGIYLLLRKFMISVVGLGNINKTRNKLTKFFLRLGVCKESSG